MNSRRLFLQSASLGAAFFTVPGAFAQQLVRTAAQTEGPFYPNHLPLDTDNDLIIINDGITPAVGEITHVTGRILDATGKPIRNALVEIWQCDKNGAYLHTGTTNAERRDKNFQGFGRFLTGSTGEYYFRTIKPVPYPGRTPHIHYMVKIKGRDKFTTQLYIKGDPGNAKDQVLKAVTDSKARETLMSDFLPIKGSKTGDLSAKFDIILGFNTDATV
jgi:protocatechuate 3,4-dioxygenase, beta subunit